MYDRNTNKFTGNMLEFFDGFVTSKEAREVQKALSDADALERHQSSIKTSMNQTMGNHLNVLYTSYDRSIVDSVFNRLALGRHENTLGFALRNIPIPVDVVLATCAEIGIDFMKPFSSEFRQETLNPKGLNVKIDEFEYNADRHAMTDYWGRGKNVKEIPPEEERRCAFIVAYNKSHGMVRAYPKKLEPLVKQYYEHEQMVAYRTHLAEHVRRNNILHYNFEGSEVLAKYADQLLAALRKVMDAELAAMEAKEKDRKYEEYLLLKAQFEPENL